MPQVHALTLIEWQEKNKGTWIMQLHAQSPCVSKPHKRTLSVQLTSKISPFLDAPHAHLQPHLALVHVCPQQVNGHPGDAQNTSTIHSELRRALDRDQRWRWKALVPLARLFASDFGSARSCLSIVEPPPSRPPRLWMSAQPVLYWGLCSVIAHM